MKKGPKALTLFGAFFVLVHNNYCKKKLKVNENFY